MDLLKAIDEAWKWKVLEPVEIIDENAFENVIVRTAAGYFWRICPEELDAKMIADSEDRLKEVRSSPEFVSDWKMEILVQKAKDLLGDPGTGRCYCLKIPAVMGGEYSGTNIGTINIAELLSSSGELAKQIDGLPDGSKVRLVIK